MNPKIWEFIHNAVAHPLMAFSGNSVWSNTFHDYTANKAFPRKPETPQ